VLFEIERYFYMENMREILPAYACECVHRDFRYDFSTDLSTVMAQMHVTPYVPSATSRRTMSSVSTASRADRQGGNVTVRDFIF